MTTIWCIMMFTVRTFSNYEERIVMLILGVWTREVFLHFESHAWFHVVDTNTHWYAIVGRVSVWGTNQPYYSGHSRLVHLGTRLLIHSQRCCASSMGFQTVQCPSYRFGCKEGPMILSDQMAFRNTPSGKLTWLCEKLFAASLLAENSDFWTSRWVVFICTTPHDPEEIQPQRKCRTISAKALPLEQTARMIMGQGWCHMYTVAMVDDHDPCKHQEPRMVWLTIIMADPAKKSKYHQCPDFLRRCLQFMADDGRSCQGLQDHRWLLGITCHPNIYQSVTDLQLLETADLDGEQWSSWFQFCIVSSLYWSLTSINGVPLALALVSAKLSNWW